MVRHVDRDYDRFMYYLYIYYGVELHQPSVFIRALLAYAEREICANYEYVCAHVPAVSRNVTQRSNSLDTRKRGQNVLRVGNDRENAALF